MNVKIPPFNHVATGRFYLEQQINEAQAKKLVELTIQRLQAVESPSLSKLHFSNFNRYYKTPDWV